jgi:hypothetical protein
MIRRWPMTTMIMTGTTMTIPNALMRCQGRPKGFRAWKTSVIAMLMVFELSVAVKASGLMSSFQATMKLMRNNVIKTGLARGITTWRSTLRRFAPSMRALFELLGNCLQVRDEHPDRERNQGAAHDDGEPDEGVEQAQPPEDLVEGQDGGHRRQGHGED